MSISFQAYKSEMFSPATTPIWNANFFRHIPESMDKSPDRNTPSPFISYSPGGQPRNQGSDRLDVPERPPSRTPSPTQYAFITSTGDEGATAARQKLKTVRSHVMKNYLQQQQRQGQGAASSDRRKGKQRARSSRSNSHEVESNTVSPARSDRISSMAEIGSLFSGFSLANPFASFGGDYQSSPGTCKSVGLSIQFWLVNKYRYLRFGLWFCSSTG